MVVTALDDCNSAVNTIPNKSNKKGLLMLLKNCVTAALSL